MFKKLFGKKDEKPFEVEQDWASYMCMVKDKPTSILLNLALIKIAPVQSHKQLVCINISIKNPDEYGFPHDDEFDTIDNIEDELHTALENVGAIPAGAVKSNGLVGMFFYAKNTKGYEKIIDSVMKNYKGYEFGNEFKEDDKWETYLNFLYPPEYEYQTIYNQRVLMSLMENGDNPELEREVDHWIYFNSEQDMKNYIAKIEPLEYKVLSQEMLTDSKEFPWQLNISRTDNVIFENVNKYVWDLVVLANDSTGYYDGWGCAITK